MTLLRRGMLVILAAISLGAVAAPTPHEVVEVTTRTLIEDIEKNRALYRQDSEAFYQSLNNILGPVVDAEGISRSIMTVKYSRSASEAQMARFQENFKRSLLEFYGRALLEYNDQEIRYLPAVGKQQERRASVNTEIVGSHGEIYPVSYTMIKKDGAWKVRNVIVNGINIGKLFRDQFQDAMNRNGRNLDKTIDSWGDVVAQSKSSPEVKKAAGDE